MEGNESAGKNNRHSYPEHIQFLKLQDLTGIPQGEMGKHLVPAGTNQGTHLLFSLQMEENKKACVKPFQGNPGSRFKPGPVKSANNTTAME